MTLATENTRHKDLLSSVDTYTDTVRRVVQLESENEKLWEITRLAHRVIKPSAEHPLSLAMADLAVGLRILDEPGQ